MKNKRKWIIGIISTLLLAIIGNALWQDAVRPLSIWFYKTTFALFTLGQESLSNDVYKNIAKGFHENNSLVILELIGCTIFGGATFFVLNLFDSEIGKKIKNKYTEKLQSADTLEQLDKELKRLELTAKRLRSFLILSISISCMFILLVISRYIYINGAITEYEQLRKICKPYMTSTEDEFIQSKFAQITAKREYIAVVLMLRDRAHKNNLYIPKSNIYSENIWEILESEK